MWWEWLRKLCRTFAFLSGVATLLMMSVGALDIITTYIFLRPIPATFEFMETMLVVVAFFAIPLAQSQRAHIRVELIYNHMPKFLQLSSDLFGYILNIIFYLRIIFLINRNLIKILRIINQNLLIVDFIDLHLHYHLLI